MIGLLDSGLGGLETLFFLCERHHNTSFVALADQINAPYGDKKIDELMKITRQNLDWFRNKGVRKIIVACNTLCSTVVDELKDEYRELEIINIVDLMIEYLKEEKLDSLLIIGTKALIKSKRYQEGLKNDIKKLYALPTSKLVPLIEGNITCDDVLKEYLEPYQGKVENILLGCTHYPIIKEDIKKYLPINQYDANMAIEKYVKFEDEDNSSIVVYTTNNPDVTKSQIKKLFGRDVEVKKA